MAAGERGPETGGSGQERVVLRGRLAPLVCYPVAVVVLAILVVVAFLLPAEGALTFGVADRAAIVIFGLAVTWFLHRLASVRIVADASGLVVRNLLRVRRLAWPQVLAVRFSPDDPWAVLDLSDGTALSAMGIQSADGDHAMAQARRLAALVDEHSAPKRDT